MTAGVAENILNARNFNSKDAGALLFGLILMDTSNMTDGDYAGLAFFSRSMALWSYKEGDDAYIIMVDKGVEKKNRA